MQVETKSHHTVVDVTRYLLLIIMSEMGLSYGRVVSILAVLLSRDGNPNPNQLKQKEHLSAHFSEKEQRSGWFQAWRQAEPHSTNVPRIQELSSLSPHLSQLCFLWADSIWKQDPCLRVRNGFLSSPLYIPSDVSPAGNSSSLFPRNSVQGLIASHWFTLGSISIPKLITVARGCGDLIGLSLAYRLQS